MLLEKQQRTPFIDDDDNHDYDNEDDNVDNDGDYIFPTFMRFQIHHCVVIKAYSLNFECRFET